MSPFLIDVLVMLVLLSGRRHRKTRAGADPQVPSSDRATDATRQSTPEAWATRRPEPASATTPVISDGRPAGYLSGAIPVWTALDDHQLTRLLERLAS